MFRNSVKVSLSHASSVYAATRLGTELSSVSVDVTCIDCAWTDDALSGQARPTSLPSADDLGFRHDAD